MDAGGSQFSRTNPMLGIYSVFKVDIWKDFRQYLWGISVPVSRQ